LFLLVWCLRVVGSQATVAQIHTQTDQPPAV